MLAFSSACSAAEGGVLRTLVGDRTSLFRGIFRTAGAVVMCGYSAAGGRSPLSSSYPVTEPHASFPLPCGQERGGRDRNPEGRTPAQPSPFFGARPNRSALPAERRSRQPERVSDR